MYFDVRIYRQMVGLARKEDAETRRRLYFLLFGVVPAMALMHAACMALDHVLYPGLRRTEVREPVFIIGHARSGTTLLHRLLCADGARYSYFRLYEMFFPSVLEKKAIRALGRLDRRVLGGRIEARVKAWDERRFAPMRGMHGTGLFKAEEDDFVMALSCASGFWIVLLPYMGRLDFYFVDEWPERRRRRLMRFYRECVRRQLYLNGPDRTHLSKNPTFCGRVESLVETFPDARFVVPVRNPYETIPSLLKLLQTGWKWRGWDDARIEPSLRALASQSFHTYRYPFEVLERHPQTPAAVIDYAELTRDPRAAVERVYKELGIPMSAELTATLEQQEGRQAEHESRNRYSLDEFGLDRGAIHAELAPLFARFGWDEE